MTHTDRDRNYILYLSDVEWLVIGAGNKVFSFPDVEVDLYLPQLVNMYIQMQDVAEVIHPYLVHR